MLKINEKESDKSWIKRRKPLSRSSEQDKLPLICRTKGTPTPTDVASNVENPTGLLYTGVKCVPLANNKLTRGVDFIASANMGIACTVAKMDPQIVAQTNHKYFVGGVNHLDSQYVLARRIT